MDEVDKIKSKCEQKAESMRDVDAMNWGGILEPLLHEEEKEGDQINPVAAYCENLIKINQKAKQELNVLRADNLNILLKEADEIKSLAEEHVKNFEGAMHEKQLRMEAKVRIMEERIIEIVTKLGLPA